jgi:hypothetical protein
MQLKKYSIKKKKLLNFTDDVYDISVKDESHYILKDGIVSHNSGVTYNSSITVNLSKAQMKDSTGQKVGVTVTCKLDKARFTVPGFNKKIQIHFYKGMNPYIGLESFMNENTFDELGFGPGKISGGEYTYDGKDLPSFFAVKETGKNIKRNDAYTSKFFTPERLEVINKLAYQQLSYKNAQDLENIEEMNDEIEVEENEIDD